MMTTSRRAPACSGRIRAATMVIAAGVAIVATGSVVVAGTALVATGSVAAARTAFVATAPVVAAGTALVTTGTIDAPTWLAPTAAFSAPAIAAAQDTPRVWILPFVSVDGPENRGDLGEYIGGLLEVLLSHSGQLSVVDRQHLYRVMGEHDLALRWPMGDGESLRLGQMLGASVMINGSFRAHEDALLVSAHAYDVESGRLLGSASATGDSDDTAGLVEQIHDALVSDLGAALPALPTLSPDQIDPSPLANLHFLQGLSQYYAGRYPQALAKFIDAAAEPRLEQVARLWMANCYLADAQYGHAYLELRRIQLVSELHLDSRLDEIDRKLDSCRRNLSQEEIRRLDRLVSTAQIVVEALPVPGQVEALPGPRQVEALPDSPQTATTPRARERHYFGQREVELLVRISGESDRPVRLRARLHQLASTLSVPYGVPTDLASNVPVSADRPTTISLPLTLPAVERETSFDVVFSTRVGESASWVEAGRAPLRVYPADLLEPLRVWSRTTRLRVRDEPGALRRFLTANDIAFVDSREARAPGGGAPVVTVVVGDTERLDRLRPPAAADEATVVFRGNTDGLPKVTVRPHGEGRLVVVEMDILEALDQDPRAQKALIEIFQLTLPGALQ